VVGDEEISFFFEVHRQNGIALTLRRMSKTMNPIGSLLIGASPFETTNSIREEGMESPNWIPKHGPSFRHPAYSQVMKIPSDIWELEVEDLPRISVKVDRMLLNGGGAIDVADLFLYPHGSLPHVDTHVVYRSEFE
jgi:hypothetical protein